MKGWRCHLTSLAFIFKSPTAIIYNVQARTKHAEFALNVCYHRFSSLGLP